MQKLEKGGWYLGLWEIKKKERQGFGYFVYEDGALYAGMWKDNMRQGFGRIIFGPNEPDHVFYEGDFVRNEFEGRGKFKWRSGTLYEGELENNQPDGEGTIYFSSGLKYRGHWENGQWHGAGKEYYKEGGY